MPPALLWPRPSWTKSIGSFAAIDETLRFSERPRGPGARSGFCAGYDFRASDRTSGTGREVVKRTEDEFLKTELQELGRRIQDARIGIVTFLEQSAARHVYWVERRERAAQFLTLNASPIDIAPVLRRMIFRDNCCCVLTSATLSVGRPDLAYFRDRIGAGAVEPLQVGSPSIFPRK